MRRFVVRLFPSLLLLGALGCLEDPGPFRFQISGTVRSAADLTPVAGATVRLMAPLSIVEPNEVLAEATTDASGRYAFTAPVPTGYEVQRPGGDCSIVALFVSKEGFATGPDEDGAGVRCTRGPQVIDVLMPAVQ